MSDKAFEEEDDKKKLEKAKKGGSITPLLDMFARNLNDLAKNKKLDPVIGMEDEIEQITQILNKRKKNNVLVLGEAGVGKSCLVEGLAIKIANKETDRSLWDKKIFDLNVSLIVSGTKYRGEFENRMKELINEIKDNPNVIIFIDELHTLIGAGSTSGALDASNIMKPALARGEIRCIGAMTFEDHKKHFAGDPAMDRRFQKVIVKQPDTERMESILMNIKGRYEEFHNVLYDDESIRSIVSMCDRYIPYRNFPDKAIDVMDEVGAFTKMKGIEQPEECIKLEDRLKEIVAEKMTCAVQQRYEDAAKMRDEQRTIQLQLDKLYASWKEELSKNKVPVKLNDVAAIISKHSGVPINKLSQGEKDKLRSMETDLNAKVIGQSHAVKKVCQAIKRSKMEIQDPNRPFVMMFLGKTGTGKTHLAKAIAKFLFDVESSFIRLDMSEYSESNSISKLIGSSPGYVGYENKGGLTEKVKNNPYSLILLDEIEKAHPDIFNVFLQIFDEGRLTDNHGSDVSFKNCMIIMTSNIGTKDLLDKNVGFDVGGDLDRETEDRVMKELKKSFKPELINRIDEKIIFNSIAEKEAEQIIDIEMDVLKSRLSKKGLTMTMKPSMRKFLVENGFDIEYGARPLKRLITSVIENEVAQNMLDDKLKSGDSFDIGYDVKKNKAIIDVKDRK